MFICRKLLKGAAIVSRPWRADKDYKKSCYSFTLISLVIFGLFPLFEEGYVRLFSGCFLHLFVRGGQMSVNAMCFKCLKIHKHRCNGTFLNKKVYMSEEKSCDIFCWLRMFFVLLQHRHQVFVCTSYKEVQLFFAHFIGVLEGYQPSDGHDRRLCVFPVLPLAVWGLFSLIFYTV